MANPIGFATQHQLRVEHLTGDAATLHHRPMAEGPALEVLHVTRPAVVLGSAQRDVELDATAIEAAGRPDVVRRRGGGGAVWVGPTDGWWFDVTIRASDPRWSHDVGKAFEWLGDALAGWLTDWGFVDLAIVSVARGPMVSTPWSQAVCFAGVGPGEVMIGDRKLVGVSQRRTRDAARFMCWMPATWSAHPLVDLLVAEVDLDAATRALVEAGIGLSELADDGETLAPGGVDDAVLSALTA